MCNKLLRSLMVVLLCFGFGQISFGQEYKQKVLQSTNQSDLKAKSQSLKIKNQAEKQKALQIAAARGLETKGVTEDGRFFELMRIEEDGTPIYYQTYNVDAAKSTRANTLHSGGVADLDLTGSGMEVHVWDGGHALTSHQEYDGSGGYNRVSVADSPFEANYHSGHVIGTILASGYESAAKGMAPYAQGYSYDWTDDDAEASTAASDGMILSNHSYGYRSDLISDYYFGAYINESKLWDQIMHDAPYYLMVCAAGNDGANDDYNDEPLDGYSDYDKLSGHSTSKNNLVVANTSDASIDANGDLISVSRHWSSSEGPTDDYRIKPDIAGNGVDVYSSGTDSDSNYETLTGTSMASPNVTGTLILLQEHYQNLEGEIMRAATLKGLALHTADDISPEGPDALTGWGLMNAKKAAEVISQKNTKTMMKELTLSSGQSYTTTVNASSLEDLKVSISWTDPPGQANTTANSNTPVLINDLDLRVTQGESTYYPWRLTGVKTNGRGDNDVDPFERIDISNASGEYTITVSNDGNLAGNTQKFSLIVTGISSSVIDNEAPTEPQLLNASNILSTSVKLDWEASSDNIGVVGYEIFKDGELYSTVTVNNTLITGLEPNTSYSFKVRAYDAEGNQSAFSNIETITTEDGTSITYCESSSDDSTNEHISGVIFGSINNSSSNSAYTDYTKLYTDVERGQSYELSVSKGWTGTQHAISIRTWIDWNLDGDFDDTGEFVFDSDSSKDSPVIATVTVPNNATIGITRMRVIAKYSSGAPSCGSYTYGETEDYSINILGDQVEDTESPTMPSELVASDITTSSVNLSWSASSDNVGVTGYDVYQDGQKVASVSGTTASITGLTENTTYSFYVVAKDAAGNISTASSSLDVTTLKSGDATCTDVIVNISTDRYGSETSWDIKDANGNVVVEGSGYSGNSSYETNECLTDGCYTFTIYDSYGDGICCTFGEGSYSVSVNGEEVAFGGEFASSEETEFCIGNEPGVDTQAPTSPDGLIASNITLSSVDLSWTASTDNVGVTEYFIYQDGVKVDSTTSTELTVSGLAEDTTYSFTISAIDAAGNESEQSAAVSVTTLVNDTPAVYCELKGNNSSYEWIDYVSIGDIANYSGDDNGYGDYTDMIADISYGDNTIYVSTGYSGTEYTENWYVWIDFNQDGEFSASEKVTDGATKGSEIYDGIANVPTTAKLGKTRMRVAMKYSASEDSCGSFSYGEVEDYTVNITDSSLNAIFANQTSKPMSKIENIQSLSVYPNPVRNDFTVQSTELRNADFQLINARGVVVLSGEMNDSKQLNASNLNPGIYILKLNENGRTQMTKVIVSE